MAFAYSVFDTTPANLIADLKTKILLSSDWSNPSGNVVKCTTPLGATMAIDLTGSTVPTTLGFGAPYIWRQYATSSGTDRLDGYGWWWKTQNTGATTTIPLHVTVSAGNTLLWITVEGPRAGEAFADNATYGSFRQTVAIAQLTPYFAADTTPQVVVISSGAYTGVTGPNQAIGPMSYIRVGQNMALNGTWVTGQLMALCFPTDVQQANTVMPNRGADGSVYLSPYVVFEHQAGLRGRLTDLYFAGINHSSNTTDIFATNYAAGDVVTIGGNNYTVIAPYRGNQANNWDAASGFGWYRSAQINDSTRGPLVAVRTS